MKNWFKQLSKSKTPNDFNVSLLGILAIVGILLVALLFTTGAFASAAIQQKVAVTPPAIPTTIPTFMPTVVPPTVAPTAIPTAIPGKVIYACITKNSGTLVLTNATTKCPNHEQKVSWQVTIVSGS